MTGRIRSGYHAGACRSCGAHDITSAPDSCARCFFEAAIETGRAPAVDREVLLGRRYYDACWEDLSSVAEHLRGGRVPDGRYQVFIDPGDGILRPLHGADNVQARFEHRSADQAEAVARQCAALFDSAWVVTYHGIWRVRHR